jgi:hypothetical protein
LFGGDLTHYRIAADFSVIKTYQWPSRNPLTLIELQQKSHSPDQEIARRARMALAALGHCDWQTATRDMRAAFLYGEIVRATATAAVAS